jgi:hypothetical protein
METIVRTTTYWLYKKAKPDDIHDNYWYVRATTDGINSYSWGIGYKNRHGLISFVGGELPDSKVAELETEFKAALEAEYQLAIKKA